MSIIAYENGYVYLIQNSLNGKSYIGCTITDVKERFRQHIRDAIAFPMHPLYKDFNAHGVDKFKLFTIGHLQKCTRDMIEALENDFISSFQPEYNTKAKSYDYGRFIKKSIFNSGCLLKTAFRQSNIEATLKWRSQHKQDYNNYQRNRYNSNLEAKEKKKALMRAYNARKREERKKALGKAN